jgi:hypothetical protein
MLRVRTNAAGIARRLWMYLDFAKTEDGVENQN